MLINNNLTISKLKTARQNNDEDSLYKYDRVNIFMNIRLNNI
jgi:hypothetical protein